MTDTASTAVAECAVCKNPPKDEVVLTCTHSYCRSCLMDCMDVQQMCPTCGNYFTDVEVSQFCRSEQGHKLLIHQLSDAYQTISEKISHLTTLENADVAKQMAVDSYEKVKQGISNVATMENLDLVKNKTVEGVVVAKDAVVGVTTSVIAAVSQNDQYKNAKETVGNFWSSLW